jgi:hypothetical protein
LNGAAELRTAPPNQGVRPGRNCAVHIDYRRPQGKRMHVIPHSILFIAAQFL